MREEIVKSLLAEVGIPFHGKIPKPGAWSHFHDNPAKKGGPYFMRLNVVRLASRSCLLFIAGDMRKQPPTLVQKLFDAEVFQPIKIDRGDLDTEFQIYEAELAQKVKLKNDSAALEAERIWKMSSTDGLSNYMRAKNIDQLYGCRISPYKDLVIPLRDIEGKLWNLQTISKPGDRGKYFLAGSKKKGCFHLIGEIKSLLYFCEGFATGVSIHKATGEAVCVSIDSGNMRSVARIFRKKFPGLRLVLCADRDEAGLTGAKAAAIAVGGEIIVPEFGFVHPDYKDFNDMELNEAHGGVKVRDQFVPKEMGAPPNAPIRARSFSFSKQDWLREYLETHQIEFLYDGRVISEGRDADLEVIRARMYLGAEREGLKIGEKMIDSFLTTSIDDMRQTVWQKITEPLRVYDPSGLEEAKVFLECLTGKVEEESLTVLLHTIWQIKQKAFDRKVDHHMMTVFEGETGGGKSETVYKFLSPLAPLFQKESMDCLSDQRRWGIFNRFLVLNMDEMEKADKTDLAGLKRTITSDILSYRILGTHLNQSIRNKTTLIGSTNESIDTLIKDHTSNRRFYSIQTLGKLALPKNHERINRIDYVNLLRAVDMEKPTPLSEKLREIQIRQEEMKFKDSVELWIEEFSVSRIDEKGRGVLTSDAYERSYRVWASDAGMHPVTKDYFSKRLVKLGFQPIRIGSKQSRGFAFFIDDPRIIGV